MPVEFLTDAQVAAYGRFTGPPSRVQLKRFFFLDDADRRRVDQRRWDSHRLGFAVQLGTVRFLGTFLADPLEVPAAVVAYLAAQLRIAEPACFRRYADRAKTPYEHAWEIRRAYGYREFGEAEAELRAFLAARAWASPEGPHALFDRATGWLLAHKVLLPGATTLARLVAAVRAAAAERLWRTLTDAADRLDPALRRQLEGLLAVEAGARASLLERLRTPPSRLSGPALVRALERVEAVRALGAGAAALAAALAAVPPTRLRALARYGLTAKAPQLRRLAEPRRTATLLATARELGPRALDDALDVFDGLLATTLLGRAEREARESARDRLRDLLRRLARVAAASAVLVVVVQYLLDALATDDAVPLAELWRQIERHVGGEPALTAAVATVVALAPAPDAEEDADAAWRAELVKHYRTVRPFLPRLPEVVGFGAVEGGRAVLEAVRRLPALLAQKVVRRADVAGELVAGSWRRFVYLPPPPPVPLPEPSAARGDRARGRRGGPGAGDRGDEVDRRAYALCVLEHLHHALRRRDVFAAGSDRWGDPRARLLDGAAWARAKPEVLTALGLPEEPAAHLAELAGALDAAYREAAARLPAHPALEVTPDPRGRPRLHLARLAAEPEPPSLVDLRRRVRRLLPAVELPELLLEVHAWTGYLDEFTHVSEAGARLDGLPLSVAALLVAEACNLGLRPVAQDATPALTRDRLSHVDQNYVRAETLRAANARLLAAQATIPLAQAWGGGLVATVDGLRFVVPVATVHAGPNPRYFGVERGVTWLNALNDQRVGPGALLVPGTVRDSLYTLDLLLNLDGGPRPRVVVSDTASYSDLVFGLFRILGYQFAPRIADLADTRLWRLDAPGYPGHRADYGPLNGVARSRIHPRRIAQNWPDMLRVVGSLVTGAVRAYDLLRMLSRDGRPAALGQAFTDYGRLAKTQHLLAVLDADDTFRRQLTARLNLHEGRHRLARRLCHGQKGELRQRYREGQEDQLGALGLVLNAIVLWNTRYLDAALLRLRAEGYPVRDEDVEWLSPRGCEHINLLGRYHSALAERVARGRLRPLREPPAGEAAAD
jgi:TnpA family transposase